MSRPVRLLLAGALSVAAFAFTGCDPCNAGPGTICTWAGTGKAAYNGEGRDRLDTAMYWPMKVRFAPDGRAVMMDWNNHRVRWVEKDDTVQTFIGNSNIGDGADDNGDLVKPGVDGNLVNLNHPTDFAFLPDGTGLLAAWHNHKLRAWDPKTNLVYVAAGRGAGFSGDGGPLADALLDQPRNLLQDPDHNIYFVDQRNQRIRKIRASDQVIETVVGTGEKGYGGDEGPPLEAKLAFPSGSNPQPGGALAMDQDGKLYIADTENDRIRVVDLAANTIRTLAGTGVKGYSGDGGAATEATLNHPRDLAFGPDGNLYIADTENHVIREIEMSTGKISTFIGSEAGFEGDGGPAQKAKLDRPFGITFDPDGNLYIADTFNNRIRRVAAWSK